MDFKKYKDEFVEMSKKLGYDSELDVLKGIDRFLKFMDEIRKDSGIIIIKLDGEREKDIYALLVSGKNLGEEGSIRFDTSDLEGGLSYICVKYARIAWQWD